MSDVDARIAKIDEEEGLVFGWASIVVAAGGQTVVDSHGDIIDPDELEGAVYPYVLKFGDAGQMHAGDSVGKLVESMVFTVEKWQSLGVDPEKMPIGWWVGYKIDDSDVFAKIKSGEYPAFSIQGRAERVDVDGED